MANNAAVSVDMSEDSSILSAAHDSYDGVIVEADRLQDDQS